MRTNVTHEFGNLSVEGSTLVLVITWNLGISFDPELSFTKQIDTVVKNCNSQICNVYAISKHLSIQIMFVSLYELFSIRWINEKYLLIL